MTAGRGIYLAGLSGSGKSSVAERIGRWLGWPVHDIDAGVERRTGRSIAALWADEGEAAFRRAERDEVARLTDEVDGPAVVALGGGTLEDAESRERLARWGLGFWLEGSPESLAARVADGAAERPLLAGGSALAALRAQAAQRTPRLAALPQRVATDDRPLEAVATDVLRTLEWPEPEPVAEGVWVGRGALAAAGRLLADAVDAAPGEVVVTTDERVWSLHGDALASGLAAAGWAACPRRLPEGEAAKDVAGLEALWRALVEAGADRDRPLAVLGGGALGDVGGLAAATFKRGLPLALFPTTLLAQVDAAIGGKNAIDFAGVKNLVGTFHFPRLVAIDPLCALTLPEREYRAGWAEVVKAGLVGDGGLFALCEREPAAIGARRLDVVEEGIGRAARMKAAVVAADPREAGRRRTLNLGHTLGHAVEAAAGGRLLHGEAVAIGTVAVARLAEAEGVAAAGLADRIAAALGGLGLPTAVPGDLDPAVLAGLLRHDKKRSDGRARVVLPVAPGEVAVRPLDEAALVRWTEASAAR